MESTEEDFKIKNQITKETWRFGRRGGFRSLQEQRWLLSMAQPFRITATQSTFQSLTSFLHQLF